MDFADCGASTVFRLQLLFANRGSCTHCCSTVTLLFHTLGRARSLHGDGEISLECARQSPQTSKTGNVPPLPQLICILFSSSLTATCSTSATCSVKLVFYFFLLYLPNKWETLLLRESWFLCLEINFWVNWILCDCMHNLKCSWNHHSRI